LRKWGRGRRRCSEVCVGVQKESVKEVCTRQTEDGIFARKTVRLQTPHVRSIQTRFEEEKAAGLGVEHCQKEQWNTHHAQSTLSRRFCHQDQNPAYNIYRIHVRSSTPLFLGCLCSSHSKRIWWPGLRLRTDHHRVHSNLNEQKLRHFGRLPPYLFRQLSIWAFWTLASCFHLRSSHASRPHQARAWDP